MFDSSGVLLPGQESNVQHIGYIDATQTQTEGAIWLEGLFAVTVSVVISTY